MPHKPLAASDEFYTPETPGDLYSDAVRELDWSVGRDLAQARAGLDLDQRTLVCSPPIMARLSAVTTAGLRGMKGHFRRRLRVPAIAWQPGRIPAGAISDALAATVDFFPTIVKAAGARAARGSQDRRSESVPASVGVDRQGAS